MTSAKYIGLDVHQATTAAAVLDANGKLLMESILETHASTLRDFLAGIRGELNLTFEEGVAAEWLYGVLKSDVDKIVVCDPRKNALLKAGNKNDRIDARKLAELLRGGQLKQVYHGNRGVRTLKELARSYVVLTRDVTRGPEPHQSGVSQHGHPLCWPEGVSPALPPAVAGTVSRAGPAAKSRTTVSTVGSHPAFAAASEA